MGGKSSPDFGSIAAAEGEESRQSVNDQLYANRPDQYSPWGYTSWNQEPVWDESTNSYTTKWSQTTGLPPALQDIFDKQVAMQGGKTDVAGSLIGRMGSEFGNQMDWSGMNPMGQVPTAQYTLPEGDIGNPNMYRQHAEDAAYGKAQSRLDPQFQGQRDQLEMKMLNQGLTPQDAQWKSQMAGIANQETDAYGQARMDAVGQGRQESNQMWNQMMGQNQNMFNQALGANNQNWNQSMQGSQYANQIRQQQMTEAMQKRGFSLNEINALLSGQQVGMPSMPNFSQAGQAGGTDMVGAAAADASNKNASNPWNQFLQGAGVASGFF